MEIYKSLWKRYEQHGNADLRRLILIAEGIFTQGLRCGDVHVADQALLSCALRDLLWQSNQIVAPFQCCRFSKTARQWDITPHRASVRLSLKPHASGSVKYFDRCFSVLLVNPKFTVVNWADAVNA